jgi:hypothetical protein
MGDLAEMVRTFADDETLLELSERMKTTKHMPEVRGVEWRNTKLKDGDTKLMRMWHSPSLGKSLLG